MELLADCGRQDGLGDTVPSARLDLALVHLSR